MRYRRGFKSEANWYAREMRVELGLAPHAPLCPRKLAHHLEYTIVELSSLANSEAAAVSYLMSKKGQGEFSAITLKGEQQTSIVHNDAHHPRRQASNIAHELAHGLLMHPFAPLIGQNGARIYDGDMEAEANWLGPALLVSEEAAMFIAERGHPHEMTCKEYGVSQEVLLMRLQVTGALIRLSRRRGKIIPAAVQAPAE
jgi:Zn-dependent peptidase ImmA (M78 family)